MTRITSTETRRQKRIARRTKTVGFTHFLVIVNPVSTNAQVAAPRIKELRRLFSPDKVTTIETSPKGRKANEKLIIKNRDLLGEKTLLCIVGGDGTVNTVISTLLLAPELSKKQRKTTILPLWGGNANDLAYMLNGFAFGTRMIGLLRKANIIEVYPLQCTLHHPDGVREVRIAAGYASFGATAFAARRLNEPNHRHSWLHRVPGGRLLQEMKTVLGAFIEAPTFTIEENGQEHVAYERIFARGSRMARIDRLPGRLTDSAFYRTTFEHKHLSALLLRLGELFRGRRIDKVKNNNMQFTTKEDVWAQFDGEVILVPGGTQVTLQLSQQPFYALSTARQKRK